MKRSSLILFAVSSLSLSLIWASPAQAATRPHYGGTLHIAVREAPSSFDPATLASTGPAGLSRLVFETLVTLDDRGRPQPLLATSWQVEPGNQRWRFSLRSGVSFNDGTPLDSGLVAASLRAGNPAWKIQPAAESVMIETDSPTPDLPAELALVRNAISRLSDGKPAGTGPFSVAQWDAGKHVTLISNDQYWRGRLFLDTVEVDFGKDYQSQGVLFDLGKADVIETATENIRRAQALTDTRTVFSSEPSELMALVFSREPRSEDETRARAALALTIDTAVINNVVLQGGGEPANSLLPNWLSGYAFLFSPAARDEHVPLRHPPAPWTLTYESSDPVSRVVAERILLNARDAGITLQLSSSAAADLRLVRIPLASPDPHVALSELAAALQLSRAKLANAAVDLYSAENALLQTRRFIPLLHLRNAVALRNNLHDWNASPTGEWQIENVWLAPERP